MRNPDSIKAIDRGNEDGARIIAIDRVIEYINHGKITISDSYNFHNLGKRIKEVQLCENAGFLTDKIVEQVIHGEFSMNFWPLLETTNYSKMDDEDEDNIHPSWNNLTEVLHFVSNYVRENTPGWFDEHITLFHEQTDGMFSIEYTEEEFAERLYDAIGFLGGTFRYRDSERFWALRYVIPRYLTEPCLWGAGQDIYWRWAYDKSYFCRYGILESWCCCCWSYPWKTKDESRTEKNQTA